MVYCHENWHSLGSLFKIKIKQTKEINEINMRDNKRNTLQNRGNYYSEEINYANKLKKAELLLLQTNETITC